MTQAAKQFQEAIQVLRSKIAAERQLYAKMQSQLSYAPKSWEVVARAIRSVAHYYNGEVTRYKNDLADWMNGHDVRGDYVTTRLIEPIHDYINDVDRLAREKDPELNMAREELDTLVLALGEETYAGR